MANSQTSERGSQGSQRAQQSIRQIRMVVVDEAIELTTDALNGEGAGVLTMIEVDRVLEEKTDVGRDRYVTLGDCYP